MRILSDFDGVWTDQTHEAELVLAHFAQRLSEAMGSEVRDVVRDLEAFRDTVLAEPERHGWAPKGRITAFVDEDPLLHASSIASYIDGTVEDERTERYRHAARELREPSVTALANTCFIEAATRYQEEHHALVEGAADVVHALRARGHQLTVVSNSAPEKLIRWFQGVGIEAGTDADRELVVRGHAGKWQLGESDDTLDVPPRRVYVDRPRYRQAIEAIRPDLVIGDVFSLDLALPHVMRLAGDAAAPTHLVLRAHPHTPNWILEHRAFGAVDHVVEDVAALLDLG